MKAWIKSREISFKFDTNQPFFLVNADRTYIFLSLIIWKLSRINLKILNRTRNDRMRIKDNQIE